MRTLRVVLMMLVVFGLCLFCWQSASAQAVHYYGGYGGPYYAQPIQQHYYAQPTQRYYPYYPSYDGRNYQYRYAPSYPIYGGGYRLPYGPMMAAPVGRPVPAPMPIPAMARQPQVVVNQNVVVNPPAPAPMPASQPIMVPPPVPQPVQDMASVPVPPGTVTLILPSGTKITKYEGDEVKGQLPDGKKFELEGIKVTTVQVIVQ